MKPSPLPLGLLVSLVGRSARQLVAAQVEPLGLSIQEFWTLVAIAEHPTASQAELAALRHVDEATTCRVARTLGEAGLVVAVRDPADRRRIRLELTAEGAALTRRLLPVARSVRGVWDSTLAAEEREAARSALSKVLARLEALVEAPLPAASPAAARSAARHPAPSAARARVAGRTRSPAPRGTP